ncbi:lipopolysaccharide biosynthesis protein [Xanthobacter wiegelii]|uniref:lipopolysaccharide biosynthesis protein n=1 Tax=Xanthobacter wiegelii TaxID=3119913 RepID=UPI00372A8704
MATVLRNALLGAASSAASLAATLVSTVFVARLLGPSDSGVVALVLWLVTLAASLADRGIPQIILRYAVLQAPTPGAEVGLTRAMLGPYLRSVLLVGLLSAGLAFVSSRWTGLSAATIGVAVCLFAVYALSALSIAAARSQDRFDQIAWLSVIGGLGQVVLVPVGAIVAGPVGALAGFAVRYLPQALVLPAYLERGDAAPSPGMQAYARNLWLSDLIEIVFLTRVEFLFIGYWLGEASIGFFAAGLAIASPIEQIVLQIAPALLLGFVAAGRAATSERLTAAYSNAFRFVALAILPVCVGGAAILPAVLPLAFGELFRPAIGPSIIIMLAVVPSVLSVVPWSLLAATERARPLLAVQIVLAIGTTVILAFAVPYLGLWGAAAARLTLSIATLLLLVVCVQRLIGIGLPLGSLARAALASLLCAVAAAIPVAVLPPATALFFAVPLGAAAYLIALRCLRVISLEEASSMAKFAERRVPAPLVPAARNLVLAMAPRSSRHSLQDSV